MIELPPLCSARLEIREFTASDRSVVHALLGGDRDARDRWLDWTLRTPRELAALAQPPYGDRAVVARETGEVIGAVGLVPSLIPLAADGAGFVDRSRPEVGLFWSLLPAARGCGFATEAARALGSWAFDVLHLQRIVATTEFDNHPSIRVMQRLGMRLLHNDRGTPPWLQVVGLWEAR